MMISWERGLFWLWLAGAIGWIIPITYYIYAGTKGFTLHPHPDEWIAYFLLWTLPPLFTFAVYLIVAWFGRRIWANNSIFQ